MAADGEHHGAVYECAFGFAGPLVSPVRGPTARFVPGWLSFFVEHHSIRRQSASGAGCVDSASGDHAGGKVQLHRAAFAARDADATTVHFGKAVVFNDGGFGIDIHVTALILLDVLQERMTPWDSTPDSSASTRCCAVCATSSGHPLLSKIAVRAPAASRRGIFTRSSNSVSLEGVSGDIGFAGGTIR